MLWEGGDEPRNGDWNKPIVYLAFWPSESDDGDEAYSGCERVDNKLLAATLPHLPEIKQLFLSTTSVDDSGLAVVLKLEHLDLLAVKAEPEAGYPSKITHRGLESLRSTRP